RTICETTTRRPVLIVLEDLHATDPRSIALLSSLAARLEGTRLAILATIRTGELTSSDRLAALCRIPATRRLPLSRLDEAASASGVAQATRAPAHPSIIAAIARRSGGNPFFIAELVELLEHGGLEDVDGAPVIPEGVRAVVRRRLARLSPDCGSLLGLIAVIGAECAVPGVERGGAQPGGDLLRVADG